MNYRGIKTALKKLQDQGHTIPALNSKKEVLQDALTKILKGKARMAVLAKEMLDEEIEPTAPEIIEADPDVIVEPTPAVIEVSIAPITTPEVTPSITTPEHPALTEVREIAKGLEIAIIWTIAVIRSMIRFSTPYVKTALLAALRFAIYTIALLGYWLLPKMQLVAYTFGIWGMLIALKIIRNDRGWSIA